MGPSKSFCSTLGFMLNPWTRPCHALTGHCLKKQRQLLPPRTPGLLQAAQVPKPLLLQWAQVPHLLALRPSHPSSQPLQLELAAAHPALSRDRMTLSWLTWSWRPWQALSILRPLARSARLLVANPVPNGAHFSSSSKCFWFCLS